MVTRSSTGRKGKEVASEPVRLTSEERPVPPRTRSKQREQTAHIPTIAESSDRDEEEESLPGVRMAGIDRNTSEGFDRLERKLDILIDVMRGRPSAAESVMEREEANRELGVPPTQHPFGNIPKSTMPTQRWQWVEKGVIENIISLELDADDLWKLLPADERKAKSRDIDLENTDGFMVSFTANGSSKIIKGDATKCERIFTSFAIWARAFGTYIAIRSTYDPSGFYAPALATFMANVSTENSIYSWSACLAYAQNFFRIHQEDSPESWYNTDLQLHTRYLNAVSVKSSAKSSDGNQTKSGVVSGGPHSSTKFSGSSKKEMRNVRTEEEGRKRVLEKAQQICWRYNMKEVGCKGCARQHRCEVTGCKSMEPSFSHVHSK
jgi:hypothetical protein